jgi:putative tryptophan/tyrosine transport system substrate-binding protein
VIAAIGPGALAAKSGTSTIPIVFLGGGDVLGTEAIGSIGRPGGNVTGMSIMTTELDPKRLDLLADLVPQARVIALLTNPTRTNAESMTQEVQEGARTKGVQVPVLKAATEGEIDAAFAAVGQVHASALVVAADPFFTSKREQLVALAARFAIPAIYQWREFVMAGGLVSYGPNLLRMYREVGVYVGKILNGAKPAELPVEQPPILELVINLKTAKALDLVVPQSLLARADEVIE